ncbi:unnamed protein product [Cuscuta campestris]|uniref:Pentacotripeptide-repeat region of PRORP domain-containing protein n=1 Tax=Cuscuta campestris TaxID=132261 RepID=A0A484KBJ3_9ASTE|nr:unnamed protein product [Cuscuta campestris]
MRRQIADLVRDGAYREALTLYSRLHSSSSPLRNGFTFPALLKACAKLRDFPRAQMLHTHLLKSGFQSDLFTASALTTLYLKAGSVDCALKAFDEIPHPTIDSMNALISGFSQIGCHAESFRAFGSLDSWNLRPDSVAIAGVLSGCEDATVGAQMHCWAVKIGVETCVFVATSILTTYSGSGDLVSATRLFESIENKNVVCYNAYMTGLLQNCGYEAVLLVFKDFNGLSEEGANAVTFVSGLSACAELKNLKFGLQIHCSAEKTVVKVDTMVSTSLIDMYSKCGSWQCASSVFQEFPRTKWSLITWNSMISGLMLNNQTGKAIELFEHLETEGMKPDSSTWNTMIIGFSRLPEEGYQKASHFFRRMVSSGVKPNEKSMTSLLTACSKQCVLLSGKQIHGYAIRTKCIDDLFLTTAVVDVYMKCGKVYLGERVFEAFENKRDDPALWNVMISGYGINNENEAAFEMFDRMVRENVKPSLATFNCVLSVCSHSGQTVKGWEILKRMTVDFGLTPGSKQLNILVDLLARYGQLEDARELLKKLPTPSVSVFASVLGASECHSHPDIAQEMAQKLLELEPRSPIPLVILSKLYAALGKWNEAERIRQIMDENGLKKLAGYSSIGVP